MTAMHSTSQNSYTKKLCLIAAGVLAMGMWSCSEKQEPYPNLITELADIRTDAKGILVDMTTDNGKCYYITNTNIRPHRPDTIYRAVVGYTINADVVKNASYIYSLIGAQVLADSTQFLRHDPTGIESMWRQGQYINMQLTAKTQGGRHSWGYAVDSAQYAGEKGRAHTHHHLSVHHNQCQDPTSYSQTHYCSIRTSAIPNYQNADTITVAVHTFSGTKSWTFY